MATIRDVARLAGVSVATVSRVVNGSDRVSPKTRQRVREVAGELDYWPNEAARSLTTRQTSALGVLLPDVYGEFFSEVIRGMDREARKSQHHLLLSSSHADSETILSAARSMRGRIDGLILMTPEDAALEPLGRIAERLPVVLLNPRNLSTGVSSVSIDNHGGALRATRHLIDLGHKRIATVKGPKGNVDAEERLRGFRLALDSAGLESAGEYEGAFTEPSGYRVALKILQEMHRPTAIFAANDSMAVGMLSAFGGHGVRVPEDIALTGFDDVAMARFVRPSLTTVRVDASKMGARAVQLLLAAIRDPEGSEPRSEITPAELVIRRSCGSHPSSAQPILSPNEEGSTAPPGG